MGHAHKGYFSPGDLKEMSEELARGDTKGESASEESLSRPASHATAKIPRSRFG